MNIYLHIYDIFLLSKLEPEHFIKLPLVKDMNRV